MILSKLKPDKEKEIRARADEFAKDRILSGVHWPADIEAGKRLGDEIANKLLENKEFQAELKRQ